MSTPSDVRAAYDTVAGAYDAALADELDRKPLDRALLTAFIEVAGDGTIADVGCGPGHVTRYLASRHDRVVGVDLSPGMIEVARRRSPEITFTVASMLDLPVGDGAWAGLVALYSIIHLTAAERAVACHEFARVLRPGGWALVAFHIDSATTQAGEVDHLTEFFGQPVELDGYYLDPADVARDLEAAGFTVMSTVVRRPWPGAEYPSRRAYLLARTTPPPERRP